MINLPCLLPLLNFSFFKLLISFHWVLQAFPEALFHQLLKAMVHPDRETRVGAHRIFSVVLVPSSVCPCPCSTAPESVKISDLQRTLSRTVSVFSSSAALFEKLKRDKFSFRENGFQDGLDNITHNIDGQQSCTNDAKLYRFQSSKSRMYSMKSSSLPSAVDKCSSDSSPKIMVFCIIIYAIYSSFLR